MRILNYLECLKTVKKSEKKVKKSENGEKNVGYVDFYQGCRLKAKKTTEIR